jgi:hypothetical protein
MGSFFVGVASSMVATLLIYLARFQIGAITNSIFYRFFPVVSGEYNVYSYKMEGKGKSSTEPVERKSEDKKPELVETNNEAINSFASDDQILAFLKGRRQEAHAKLTLKQFANRLNGTFQVIKDGQVTTKEKLNGKITPSRTIVLNSESEDDSHHNFGTFLLNQRNKKTILKGLKNDLCISCGDAMPTYIILEKTS